MPLRQPKSPRSRALGGRRVVQPTEPPVVSRTPARLLERSTASGKAGADEAQTRSRLPRRRPAPSQQDRRPTRPPRAQPKPGAIHRRAAASGTAAVPSRQDKVGPPVRGNRFGTSTHSLTDTAANARLHDYESCVKDAFDRITPVLKDVASHRCQADFTERAQAIAKRELGFEFPAHLLDDAWVTGLNMRRLFAWTLFETYRRFSDDFFANDPLNGRDDAEFGAFLQHCGFHMMDVTPCADGRLAHAVSYVLRLPYGPVRRKSYAGSLFDIEKNLQRWVETELRRFREGWPNASDAPSRYLKAVVYHYSSLDPAHQGCAAHSSDDEAAAREGWKRLTDFRQAVENSFCCGASVDLLLIGMDTDTDAIRVHVPDHEGNCDLMHWLDAGKVYEITRSMTADQARQRILELVTAHVPSGARPPGDGMLRLIARLIELNISQIDYVRVYHGGAYPDAGHAERFIGVGLGFEEVQLRNLTYFAYLGTVEEGAPHLDVGVKIFSGLNASHGLPIPVVMRIDYHGNVPGARERAVEHCERLATAVRSRYPKLCDDDLLHCLRAVRDIDSTVPIEVIGSSLDPEQAGGH
jgi:carboxysome shell carbonic anhydrase